MLNGTQTLITDEYRKLNSGLHEARPDYGANGHRHANDVIELAQECHARTILDYGCGKQTLGRALTRWTVIGYDPAFPQTSTDPEPADFLVCLDMLEHVEPDCLDAVLDHMASKTLKAAYLIVATRPAVKFLADGRNAHLIQEPLEWWLPKLMKRWKLATVSRDYDREFQFLGTPL